MLVPSTWTNPTMATDGAPCGDNPRESTHENSPLIAESKEVIVSPETQGQEATCNLDTSTGENDTSSSKSLPNTSDGYQPLCSSANADTLVDHAPVAKSSQTSCSALSPTTPVVSSAALEPTAACPILPDPPSHSPTTGARQPAAASVIDGEAIAQPTSDSSHTIEKSTTAGPAAEDKDEGFVRVDLPEVAEEAIAAHVSDATHHIKWVKFHGALTPVITQNINGPCPLLALINVMLLKGKVQLPAPLDVITIGQLMDYVGDAMLDTMPADLPAQTQPDFEQNMQDAVAILPNLQTGLDVNVKFTGVQDFEYTSECCIFDLLHVRLYHGWLVDPALSDVEHAVGHCGYNQLVDKIISNKSSDDPTLSHEALLAENFLETTASQLTSHGLSELTATMSDGELAVFFRNNHFSTIYKCQNVLYLLVTDQGFLREPRVVWETLTSTDGAGQFTDGELTPLESGPPPAASPHQEQADYLVALSLQEESSRQQAHDMQWEEYKQTEFVNADLLSDAELARRLQEEEERSAREQQAQQQPPPQQQQQQRVETNSRTDSKKKNCVVM